MVLYLLVEQIGTVVVVPAIVVVVEKTTKDCLLFVDIRLTLFTILETTCKESFARPIVIALFIGDITGDE